MSVDNREPDMKATLDIEALRERVELLERHRNVLRAELANCRLRGKALADENAALLERVEKLVDENAALLERVEKLVVQEGG